MQKLLRRLSVTIKDQKNLDAIKVYCELLKNNVTQSDIVYNILKDIIPILYRNKYFKVPHGIMGLMAAIDISQHIEQNKQLALAQAIYYLSHENKLAPLNFSVFVPLYDENQDKLQSLENYINNSEIPNAYRYFLGIKAKSEIDDTIINYLFNVAIQDMVNIGHKTIYFQKILELVDYLDNEPPNVYYPAISYIASDPKDFTVKDYAVKEYDSFSSANSDFRPGSRQLSADDAMQTVDIIINSMRSRVLSHISTLLQNGFSLRSIADTITIAAAQLILDTDTDEWVRPVHGFNYCYAVNWWQRKYGKSESIFAIFMQAAFVNSLSIEHKKVHFLSARVYIKHRCIIDNIIKSIRSSNVSDSVSLTQSYLLSKFDDKELIKVLANLSVQNGSIKNFTHDLKLTSSCIHEYQENSSPLKWLILVALAKHLSQSEKDYECYTLFTDCMDPDVKLAQ
jgi:hypothetical protein